MANDFFNEFNTSNLELQRPSAVDFSALPEQYQQQYGKQAEYEKQLRDLQANQEQQAVSNRQQQILAAQSQKGLGQGIYAEAQRQPFEQQAITNLSDKELKKVYEGELQKNLRIDKLRRELANKQIQDIARQQQIEMQRWGRAFSKLRQSVSNKMLREQDEARYKLQQDKDRTMRDIQKIIMLQDTGRTKTSTLGGFLGGTAGFLLSGFNPAGLLAGYNAGRTLFGGGYNLATNNKLRQDLINASRY